MHLFLTFLQALHFFIGFGALVSPLIADPFLSESGCGNHTDNGTQLLHHFRSMLRNSPIAQHNINTSHSPAVVGEEDSNVHYAFWIMALINVRHRWLLYYDIQPFPLTAQWITWAFLVPPQLPVPAAVLFLMYREQLIPCCPSSTPRLLDKDELAMENQQGAAGPDVEETEHSAGGQNRTEVVMSYRSLTLTWCGIRVEFCMNSLSLVRTCSATGHGDIFSCCQNDNLRGLPVSFFMIHILGGMVLFMTDGIVVSEGLHFSESPK